MTRPGYFAPIAVGSHGPADRLLALISIAAFVFASCTQPPTAGPTPTVPAAAPTQSPSRSAAPDPPKQPSNGDLADDDAVVIVLSELARHMRRELGPDWITLTQGAMDGHLTAAGLPPDSVKALHELMASTIAIPPAEDVAKEPRIHSDVRMHVRHSLEKPTDDEIALELRLERLEGATDDPDDDDVTGADGDDTCDLYNECRGANYTACYRYANLEVKVHEAWLMAGCALVAALGYVATLNPAAAAAVGAVCLTAPSAWSAAVHAYAMEECFTLHCGSYSSCI